MGQASKRETERCRVREVEREGRERERDIGRWRRRERAGDQQREWRGGGRGVRGRERWRE